MSICANCPGQCCRLFNTIALTGSDILRLKNALQLPYQFITKLILVPEDQVEHMKMKSAMFSFKQDDVNIEDKFIFSIKNQESTLLPGTKKCVFLQEWKIFSDRVTGRCGIYDIRPYACRAFPSTIDKETYKGIFINSSDTLQEFDFCLNAFKVEDFIDSNKQIENLALWDYEKNFFKKVAEKWNENPGKVEEVYEFFEKEYANRLVLKSK